MMQVFCKECEKEFSVPLQSAGKIDYARCKNVFRVSYRFRTPCPSCRNVLQLIPKSEGEAFGIRYPFLADEITENLHWVEPLEPTLVSAPKAQVLTLKTPISPLEKTIPRTLEPELEKDLPPTVRVNLSPRSSVKGKASRWKSVETGLLEGLHAGKKAFHFAVSKSVSSKAPKKRSLLHWAIFTIIVLSLLTTITLATIAIRWTAETEKQTKIQERHPIQNPEPMSLHREPKFNTENRNAPPSESPEDRPKGGPLDTEDDIDTALDPTAVSISDPGLSLHLPPTSRLTSGFGMRIDPIKKQKAFHKGLDFRGKYRSGVEATLEGEVIYTGWKGNYGQVVLIQHQDGLESLYGHLSESLVRKGQKVQKGELIGLLGSTGRSTGPHLHFELRKNGKKINPLEVASIHQEARDS